MLNETFSVIFKHRGDLDPKKEVALLDRTTFCIMTHEVFQKKKFCLVDGVGPFSKWASARRRWWAPLQKLVSVFWRGGQKGPPQTASITKTIFFRAVTLAQMKAPLSIQWVKKRVEDNWVSFMLRWRQKYTSKKRVEKGLKKLINQYTELLYWLQKYNLETITDYCGNTFCMVA